MPHSQVQLVGQRVDQPHSIVLRDQKGRYFLRPACGSKPVRITARDAERIMRQYRYRQVNEEVWHPASGIEAIGCTVPPPIEVDAATY